MRKKVLLIVILILCIGLVVFAGVFFQKSRVIILANYDDISYVQKSIDVTDDELQQRVKEKLSDYVTTQEQTVVEKGYLVVLDYTTYLNDIKVAEKKDQGAILGSGFFGMEFENNLVGCNVESNLSFEIDYPSDYSDSALAGKKYKFDVYIQRAMEYVYPDLTDEFAQDNLNFPSVDVFYENIKAELITEKSEQAWGDYKVQAFQQLVTNCSFYVREKDVLNRYVELVDYYALIASYQNVDVHTYAYHVLQMDKETFIDYCKHESEMYVKSVLLAKAIANKENIVIDEQDISEYCYSNNVFYEGDTPSEYLLNLILIDKVQSHIIS